MIKSDELDYRPYHGQVPVVCSFCHKHFRRVPQSRLLTWTCRTFLDEQSLALTLTNAFGVQKRYDHTAVLCAQMYNEMGSESNVRGKVFLGSPRMWNGGEPGWSLSSAWTLKRRTRPKHVVSILSLVNTFTHDYFWNSVLNSDSTFFPNTPLLSHCLHWRPFSPHLAVCDMLLMHSYCWNRFWTCVNKCFC